MIKQISSLYSLKFSFFVTQHLQQVSFFIFRKSFFCLALLDKLILSSEMAMRRLNFSHKLIESNFNCTKYIKILPTFLTAPLFCLALPSKLQVLFFYYHALYPIKQKWEIYFKQRYIILLEIINHSLYFLADLSTCQWSSGSSPTFLRHGRHSKHIITQSIQLEHNIADLISHRETTRGRWLRAALRGHMQNSWWEQ